VECVREVRERGGVGEAEGKWKVKETVGKRERGNWFFSPFLSLSLSTYAFLYL
jgi:hypothetical protein